MLPIPEEELRKTNHPIYTERVKKMKKSEADLYAAFEKVKDWRNASLKDKRAFLQLCHKSFSVAAIKINNAVFPAEPDVLFRFDLYLEARGKIIPKPFKIRIAPVEEKDKCLYFRRPQMVNRASWYRSEPRGFDACLCDLFGHEAMGYMDPTIEMKMWFKHQGGTLPYNRIKKISMEKSTVIFFEHPLRIVQIETNKKTG